MEVWPCVFNRGDAEKSQRTTEKKGKEDIVMGKKKSDFCFLNQRSVFVFSVRSVVKSNVLNPGTRNEYMSPGFQFSKAPSFTAGVMKPRNSLRGCLAALPAARERRNV